MFSLLTYTYDASGRKLRKTIGSDVRDYVDGIEYNNGEIELIQTAEGRILPENGSFIYEYALKDHLGNVRAMVRQDGSIIQVQDYYAFGMQLNANNQVTPSPDNAYKYNGKEWNGELSLNQYDYGARFYDPVVGRWYVVDARADEFVQIDKSPYAYGWNNPTNLTDPDGNCPSCPPSDGELDAVSNGDMGRGLVKSVREGATGLWNAVTSPWQTVKGLGNALAHPISTGEAIVNNISAEFNANPQIAAGKMIGVALQALVGGEMLKAVTTVSKVEKVQRAMSRAELASTESTGLVRGGRPGIHHVSDAIGNDAKRIRQRLALPQTPEVKVTLEVPKGAFSTGSKVTPKYNMPGGGIERFGTGNIPARVVKVKEL